MVNVDISKELYKKVNETSFLNIKVDEYDEFRIDIIQFKRDLTLDQLNDDRKITLDINTSGVSFNMFDGYGLVFNFFVTEDGITETLKIHYVIKDKIFTIFEKGKIKINN